MGRHTRPMLIESLEGRWLLSRLALISDFGTLQQSETDVANLVKQWDTQAPLDAILTSGDNDQNDGTEYVARVGNYYDQFIYGRGSATQRFLPVPGNHDWGYYSGRGTLTYYEDFFTLPNASQGNTSGNERYYNYRLGDVEVFTLDSDTHEPDGTSSTSVQAQWLQNALAQSQAAWQIVSFHHAAYSSASSHDEVTYMQWPFQEWGADLVVNGHNHVYERININGLRYVQNGMGGWDSLNSFGTIDPNSEVRYNGENGAMLLTANSTTLSYQFINTKNEVIDTFSMTNVPLPNIAVTAANASEAGQVGGFTFTRSVIMTGDVTVNFTLGGTATSGTDYESIPLSIVIPDGVASVTVPLTAINDRLPEGDETVILTINDDPAYVRRNTTATVTIIDDDLQTATFSAGADTNLMQNSPDTSYATSPSLTIDTDEPPSSGKWTQALLQFGDLIGAGTGQIPLGSTILSARLQLNVNNPGNAVNLYRMTTPWTDASTWNSLDGGVQIGTETVSGIEASFTPSATGLYTVDVTSSLQAWLADPSSNFGWVLNPTGTDGVDIDSFEGSTKPQLVVTYAPGAVPTASDDHYSIDEDGSLSVSASGVLGNDTDPNGYPLSAELVNSAANGAVMLNPDGSFIYTPNANFNGTDSFTYIAVNSLNAASDPATVIITVDPVNDAPTAADDSYAMTENTTLEVPAPGVLLNDSDIDSTRITATLIDGPGNGTLTFNADGSFTYTPNAGFRGDDSFTYVASDGTADSTAATVYITVNRTNVAPVAQDNSYPIDEDEVLSIASPGVLTGDSDADGDPLTAILLSGPSNGTLSLNPDGSFIYAPNANFNGTDTFTYKANDGLADSNAATVTITVNAVNDAPLAVDDSFITSEDTPIILNFLANDIDVDSDSLTVQGIVGPGNGALSLNPDGTYTYTPSANFYGTDSFTYAVVDPSNAVSNTATVTITVTPVNDAPVAGAETYSTDEDTVLTVSAPGVLENDTDPDSATLTAVLVNGPAHGQLLLNPDGSFSYTPDSNYNGADSFTYQASDGAAMSNLASVSITINPVNDPPTAVDDSATVLQDTTLTGGNVLANDSDVEGDAFTAELIATTASGSLTFDSDGTYTYAPAAGFTGTDTFTYQAIDKSGAASVPATVTITVIPPGTDDYAASESTTFGTASGLTATGGSDDIYETVQEQVYGKTKYRLSHSWQFNVTGGDQVTFYLEAYHDSAVEDFTFDYSLDGSTWTTMLTLTRTTDGDTYQTFDLPASTSGTVWVRVVDTNGSDNGPDTVYIDHMYFRSLNTGPLPTPPTVTIAPANTTISEAGGQVDFVVTRSDTGASDLLVTYSVAGTATASSDYEPLTGTVTIPAGQQSAAFSLVAINDSEYEPDETVIVSLNDGSLYDVGAESTSTVTITSDDAPSALLAAPTSLTGRALNGGIVDLTWVDNATGETGYVVEWSLDGTQWTEDAQLPEDTTTFRVEGLSKSTFYYFRVKAIGAAESSDYSNVLKIRTANK